MWRAVEGIGGGGGSWRRRKCGTELIIEFGREVESERTGDTAEEVDVAGVHCNPLRIPAEILSVVPGATVEVLLHEGGDISTVVWKVAKSAEKEQVEERFDLVFHEGVALRIPQLVR